MLKQMNSKHAETYVADISLGLNIYMDTLPSNPALFQEFCCWVCCAATKQKDKHCSQKLPELSLIYSTSLECIMNIMWLHILIHRWAKVAPICWWGKLSSKTVVSVSLSAPVLQLSPLPFVGFIYSSGFRFGSYTKALLLGFNMEIEHFGDQEKNPYLCTVLIAWP